LADQNLYVFVDNSNVLIESQRFAQMKKKGKNKLSAFTDDSFQIDWGKFLYLLKEQDQRGFVEVPTLYGSRPPAEDSIWQRIRDDGFDVRVLDRNIRNKEKGVDMEMGMDIAGLIHGAAAPKTIVMAAGDADFVPAVERAKAKKWVVEVWFWSNAADALKKAASRFVPLDKHLEFLRLGGGAIW
jgi:uncharacterized LabA/DUF88 family protein